MYRIVVTGYDGLLGFHARAALFAKNCSNEYAGLPVEFEVVLSPRLEKGNLSDIAKILAQADCVLHFAGINRAADDVVESGNVEISSILVKGLEQSGASPHVIYANSTHANSNSAYGRGKLSGHLILSKWANDNAARYSNVILPHIFGENSRPFYNTVTATLCQQINDGVSPEIHEDAKVELLHAGSVADQMLSMFEKGVTGTTVLEGSPMSVEALYSNLESFKNAYQSNIYPDLSDKVQLELFNTYRSFGFPSHWPRQLVINHDERGLLYEAVKGGGGGQSFLSWTKPGVQRGNHFHRHKVERFLVVSGNAEIEIRRLFSSQVHKFTVSGDCPSVIDMPTLHTHNITNTGSEPLLTMFWAHEVFDPSQSDTYAHQVEL